jgi:hypothetical protein
MKRTASLTIGIVLTGIMTGCASEPDNTDYTEICVDRDMTRLPEDQCDDDDDRSRGHGFIYISSGSSSPAYGSRYMGGSYTTTRPASGTIGRAPSTGGFGTHGGTAGS